jgi:3-deoxy-D-manno-octulosonic-acid transferase
VPKVVARLAPLNLDSAGDPELRTTMWHPLYQLALVLAAVLLLPITVLRRGRHSWPLLAARLGFRRPSAENGERPLWIHAVSVGEVGVASTLASRLSSRETLLVTTVTPTGQERALALFGKATVSYLPFDFSFAVKSFFRHFRPRVLVLTEGDYWPSVLREARRRDVPVIVVNGRVSDRSFRRLRRWRRYLSPLFSPVSRFGVQTDLDRERLIELGIPSSRIRVTGNLKFDSPEPALSAELEAHIERSAAGRPVLVAGSTMRGEEELVLAAFDELSRRHDAILVLAPRHPERWPAVAELLQGSGRPWMRRSGIGKDPTRPDIVLLDTLGELAGIYRLADSAFIGGTIVPTGGHNPLEAARFGVPVAVGPSMENFAEIAETFDRGAAWQRVEDSSELASCWSSWLDDPDAARRLGRRGAELVRRHQGAVERSLELLAPYLHSTEPAR